ncbi:hypothetical protein NIES4073_74640 [Kalymmatonema gypsitolerans NIES-4073]|nr:hypothetical protein NIES4073_74640 [Scytonema sp. NIES-4073]
MARLYIVFLIRVLVLSEPYCVIAESTAPLIGRALRQEYLLSLSLVTRMP